MRTCVTRGYLAMMTWIVPMPKGFHDGVGVNEDDLLDLFTNFKPLFNFSVVGEVPGVLNVNLFKVLLAQLFLLKHHVCDVHLRVDLVKETLEEGDVDLRLVIKVVSVGPVSDTGPDNSLEQGVRVDASQIVVDTFEELELINLDLRVLLVADLADKMLFIASTFYTFVSFDPAINLVEFVCVEHTKDALCRLELLSQLHYQLLGVASRTLVFLDDLIEFVEGTERNRGILARHLNLRHVPLVEMSEEPD